MNFNFKVPEGLAKALTNKQLYVQQNSPTLLFGAGIVGMVVTTVLASRATLKLDGMLEKDLKRVDDIKTAQYEGYSETDRTKDLAFVYTKSAMSITKIYAPAFAVGVISVACLTKSHQILTSRNTALMVAYTGLEKGFNEYRARVLNEVGEEKEREFRYGTEVVETMGDDGKIRTTLKVDPDGSKMYARCFDESSKQWVKTQSHNQMFVQSCQNMANDLLRARGYVFLNEVYDMLGLERSAAGQIVGWVAGNRDDEIDFGIFQGDQWSAMRFANGDERTIWLDFNVDGPIMDLVFNPS